MKGTRLTVSYRGHDITITRLTATYMQDPHRDHWWVAVIHEGTKQQQRSDPSRTWAEACEDVIDMIDESLDIAVGDFPGRATPKVDV